ncbi:MAG: hypothetical protein JO079_14155, partial [Frankiaceae bacterium]|nr:hypothetical protein [Frankiaceae bacterium]
LAYMDDNVIEANQITSTGIGGIDGKAGDAAAGVNGTAGIVVLGLPADPIGGTLIQDNVVSAVHYGVFLNEAASPMSGNGFNGVSVPVTSIPAPVNVYAGRASTGHMVVNRGTAGQLTDLGGALASPPAVGAVPTWNPNAFGAGSGYWSGTLSPVYVARTTAGRIAVRSDSVSWANLPAATSGGRAVAFTGTPAVAGSSALDNGVNGGRAIVGIAALSTSGDLWVTSILIGPNHNVVGVSKAWRNYGHPAGTALTGTPALTGLFFVNTAWAAAKNGYLYSLAFDSSTADWSPAGTSWVKRPYRAITVSGATSPDGYRTALLLGNPNGIHPGLRMTQVVFTNGVAGGLGAVNAVALSQPAVAVATNGVTDAYPATGSVLVTTGAVARNLKVVMVGGVGAVALN